MIIHLNTGPEISSFANNFIIFKDLLFHLLFSYFFKFSFLLEINNVFHLFCVDNTRLYMFLNHNLLSQGRNKYALLIGKKRGLHRNLAIFNKCIIFSVIFIAVIFILALINNTFIISFQIIHYFFYYSCIHLLLKIKFYSENVPVLFRYITCKSL